MKQLSVLFFLLFLATAASAQVSVTATAGTAGPTAYTTLKLAFDAINSGTHQGAVTINITGNTTETNTASLNASGSGAALYTSVLLKPGTGATPTVTGAVSGAPVVKLNGSNNVTIDGSNNGSTSRDLTISNTSTASSNVLMVGSVSTTPINNVTVKNSIFINGTNTSTAVLVGDAATVGSPGYFSNIIIRNNLIQKAYIGLYMYAVVSALVNNVTVTGNDLNASGANGIRLVGIYAQGLDGLTVSNNNVGNFETASAEFDRAIWFATATKNAVISGNTVSGLAYSGTSSYAPIGINVNPGITNANISVTNNTVTNLTTTGTGTTMGIFGYGASSNVTFDKNRISNIKNTNTIGYGAAAMLFAPTINNAAFKVYNNFIWDIAAYGFNGYTSEDNGNGIVIDGGGGIDLYHNTVVLNTNQTLTGGHRASCVLITANVSANNAVNMRNNILANLQTVGNANSRLVVSVLSTNGANVFNTDNFNDYYATSTNLSSLGTNGSITNTLAQLQASLGNNGSSLNILPVFVSATDLHLSTAPGANRCIDGRGISLAAVPTDIDGDTRSTGANPAGPDMGADEFTSTAITATISYTGSPYCSNAGTASVTQTGASGGTYTSTGGLTINATTGAITLGTSTPGTYTVTYTIAATSCDPVYTTTTVVTINAGPSATISYAAPFFCTSGATTAAVTQTGTTGGTYTSTAGLSVNSTTGLITVNTSTPGTYTVVYTIAASGGCPAFNTNTTIVIADCTVSVTATAGTLGPVNYPNVKYAFDAINAGTHQAVVAVNINANTTETATASLNRSGAGAAVYTSVAIRPTADNLTLTANLAATAVLKLNAAANVTIDGDNAATAGINRNLTITNTSTAAPGVVWIGGNFAAPATNDALKNCIIINGANTSSAVVTSDNATLGTAGYFNNISIQNNSIQRAYIGNFNIAVPSAGNGSGLNVSNNDLNVSGANSIRMIGVYLQGIDGGIISNNNIANFANTADANVSGIWAATGTINTTITGNNITTMSGTASAPRGIVLSPVAANANINVTGNTISGLTSSSTGTTTGIFSFTATSGVTIEKNNISNIKNTNAGGFGANGIQLGSTLTTANSHNIYNNYISDVAAAGFNGTAAGDNGYGIIITAGGGYNLYHNTVVMNTNQTVATGLPAALNITAGVTTAGTLNVRDNIFVNTQTVGTQRYCVLSNAAAGTYGDINYNDYYFTGPNLGTIGGTPRANLAAWQAGTTKDANSLSVLPIFVSATNFHLNTTGNCLLDAAGTPIAAVTTDFDGDTRSATTPDIGADEFTSAPRVAAISYAGSPYCPAGTAMVTQTGITGGTYSSATGLVINATTGDINLATSTPGTYTVTYAVPVSGGCAAFSVTTSVTINTNSTAPAGAVASNPAICAGSGVTNLTVVGGTLGTGASFKWYTGSCGGTPIGTGATLTNITVLTTTTFYVRAEGPCGNTTCASVTVNVNPVPVVVLVAANNPNINPASGSVLNATVSPSGNYVYSVIRNGIVVLTTTNITNALAYAVSPDSAGVYTVRVVNVSTGCTATSNPVVITSDPSTTNIFVTPNPNNGRFSVKYYATGANVNAMRSVTVYDGRGARVFDKTMKITGTYTSMDVDITHSASGTYYVKVTDANGKLLSSAVVIKL